MAGVCRYDGLVVWDISLEATLSNDLHESSLSWLAATGLPPAVLAGQTLRYGAGHSQPPFDSFNLALHVGDDPAQVQANRIQLLQQLAPYGCTRLVWLNQVHGIDVYRATAEIESSVPTADGIVTDQIGVGIVIMTADCLPVVLSSADGREVACAHAGWRGLLSGVIEATAHAMREPPVYAWLGAAIGSEVCEVGPEVGAQCVDDDPAGCQAFGTQPNGMEKGTL